jgi:single-strand DNA-binding protein
MAGSVNKVILVGNLGRDPEIKTFEGGGMIATFSVATSETFKNQAGEKETRTEWHRLVIRRTALAEIAQKYLRKGMSVYVEGKLQTRTYEKDNVTHYTTEVVVDDFQMLTPKSDGTFTPENSGRVQETADQPVAQEQGDDLPF